MIKRVYQYFFLFLFGILLTNNILEAQNRTDSIFIIKKLIKEQKTVSSPGVGPYLKPSKYWYAFAYLAYLSTNDELVEMTSDNNISLRIYAYFGLTYNNYPNLKEIKKRPYNDKTSVYTFFGCITDFMEPAKCIKYYLKCCYNKNDMNYLVKILKNNEEYRNQLYDELLNNKIISMIPNE